MKYFAAVPCYGAQILPLAKTNLGYYGGKQGGVFTPGVRTFSPHDQNMGSTHLNAFLTVE